MKSSSLQEPVPKEHPTDPASEASPFASGGGRGIDWASIAASLGRYAAALTGRRDEADDLTQETLARLLGKAPDSADHLGYARRTMTRLWLDRQRSMRRLSARLARWAAGMVFAEMAASACDANDRVARVEAVRRGIDALPPRQRAVITLRLIEGLTYEQIAESLECDVGAVRATLHVARGKLREGLGRVE